MPPALTVLFEMRACGGKFTQIDERLAISEGHVAELVLRVALQNLRGHAGRLSIGGASHNELEEFLNVPAHAGR